MRRTTTSVLFAPLVALALVLVVPEVRAQDPDAEDFYISLPAVGSVYRLDAQTGDMTPWVSGFGAPFYGVWSVTDGDFYLPDRILGAVFRITPQGVVKPFSAGGLLSGVVTVVQAPDGGLVCSEIFQENIVRLGPQGQQTLVFDAVSSGGLLSGPGGMAYGPDGLLYVANNYGNSVVVIDEAVPSISLVSDSPLITGPGGVFVDGSGNLFVANYGAGGLVRVRLDTGEAEVFCNDPFLIGPNDVRLSHEGGLLVTTRNSALVRIDAMGQLSVIKQVVALGEFDGVASPADSPPCGGGFLPYGAGTAGSGGVVPELRGIFSPCPGTAVALDIRGFLGGSVGALAWGLSPGDVPLKGAHLLVSLGPPGGLIPLAYPGTGPGGGALRLPFALPDQAALAGVSFYLQALAKDPGAPGGVSASNGLHEKIGS